MDWQPIETAPKDGSTLRLKLANGMEVTGEFWPAVSSPPASEGWAYDVTKQFQNGEQTNIDSEPTHWMPVVSG